MKRISLIVILFSSKTILAQIPDAGCWFAILVPVTISNKWQWHNDAGYRTLGTSISPYQFLYRTGGRFTFDKHWNTAAGFALFYTRSTYQKFNREFGGEFRLWQELNAQHFISETFSLQNRLRLEERWFKATKNREAYYGLRFRYRIATTKMITEKWGLQLADEYMRQLVNSKFSFNQNRFILTALFKINTSSQLQGGYMWLRWPSESQHIATFSFQKTISMHASKRDDK